MISNHDFIFTVSELNLATQKILEGHFSNILVEGEISNLAKPASGHLYFSLKDPHAQIRCAMFRGQGKSLAFELKNGLMVQVKAKVSIYPDRGDYQLIVESVTLAGDGLLRMAYEKLLKKLEEEGLFQAQYRKPLPSFPKHIGIITSPTGAAVRDILSVLKRRFPSIPVTIYPSKVQGAEAAKDIIAALKLAEISACCDVLILARGGGSLEDLWPFNEEAVARAIFGHPIPIITGIGHEIDFTIADFVADRRAPTPSAAAELVSPNQQEWQRRFFLIEQRLKNAMTQWLQYRGHFLDNLLKRLRHPGHHIEMQTQRLNVLKDRLILGMTQHLKEKQHHVTTLMRALNAMSPLATLLRGYAIVSRADVSRTEISAAQPETIPSEKVLSSVTDITKGEDINVRMSDGSLRCVVSEVVSEIEANL